MASTTTAQQPRLLINLSGSNIGKKKKNTLASNNSKNMIKLEQVRASIFEDIAKFKEAGKAGISPVECKKQLASFYVEASKKRAKLDHLELQTSSCIKKLSDSARAMKDMGFCNESLEITHAIKKIDYDGRLKKKFNVEDSMKQMEDTLIEKNMAEICCICQSYTISYGNNIAVLKCGHVYHLRCIVQNAHSRIRNYNSSAPCPQCREEVGLIKDVDAWSSRGTRHPTFASLTRTLSDDLPELVSPLEEPESSVLSLPFDDDAL